MRRRALPTRICESYRLSIFCRITSGWERRGNVRRDTCDVRPCSLAGVSVAFTFHASRFTLHIPVNNSANSMSIASRSLNLPVLMASSAARIRVIPRSNAANVWRLA